MGISNWIDAAMLSVNRTTEAFSDSYVEDPEKRAILIAICGRIDSMLKRYGGRSITFEIGDKNKDSMDITISPEFEDDFEYVGSLDETGIVFGNAKSICVEKGENGNIKVGFIFSGIWEKIDE